MALGPVELAVIAAGFGLLLWFALRRLAPDDVTRWASAYDLTLTGRNRDLVTGYLRRAQRWRRGGFVVGLLSSGALPGTGLLMPGLGYTAGIVAAEVLTQRGEPSGAAVLEPRRLAQYLPAKLVWIPRMLVVALLGAATWSLTIDPDPLDDFIDDTGILALAALALGVLLVAEVLEQHIVARRQPLTEVDLLAADDALRTQSLHALAGAVIIAAGSLAFPLLYRPAQADYLNPAVDLVAVLAPVAGWLVGIWYQNRAWRVRRALPPIAPASPSPSPLP